MARPQPIDSSYDGAMTLMEQPDGVAARSSLPLAVECPDCGYCLRGLAGTDVRCPECGRMSDVEQMARLYRSTWSVTPPYQRLMRTVMMSLAVLCCVITLIGLAMSGVPAQIPVGFAALCVFVAILTAVWVRFAHDAVVRMPSESGWTVLIMLHVAVIGYLLAGLGVLVGFTALVTLLIAIVKDATETAVILTCAALTLLGVLSVFAFRPLWKLDQRVGRACLRELMQ
jgi:hypothetical protein